MFIKFLNIFLSSVLFAKDENNINSVNFKPFKVLLVFVFLLSMATNIYLILELEQLYYKLKEVCPDVFK